MSVIIISESNHVYCLELHVDATSSLVFSCFLTKSFWIRKLFRDSTNTPMRSCLASRVETDLTLPDICVDHTTERWIAIQVHNFPLHPLSNRTLCWKLCADWMIVGKQISRLDSSVQEGFPSWFIFECTNYVRF